MPDGVNQRPGTANEVREAFKGWDPKIDRLLEFVSEVLEWRVGVRIFLLPVLDSPFPVIYSQRNSFLVSSLEQGHTHRRRCTRDDSVPGTGGCHGH